MAILIAPWSMLDFCIAHPLGHEHHHHKPGESTPCELRAKAIAESDGPIILPPMECKDFFINVDDYLSTDDFKVKPTTKNFIVAAILFDLIELEYQQEPHLLPPNPQCRSATLISNNSLRGPPLV